MLILFCWLSFIVLYIKTSSTTQACPKAWLFFCTFLNILCLHLCLSWWFIDGKLHTYLSQHCSLWFLNNKQQIVLLFFLGAPNNRSTGWETPGEQRLLHLCGGPGAISVVWGNFTLSLGVSSNRNQFVVQQWFQEHRQWFMGTHTATCSISDCSAGLTNMCM